MTCHGYADVHALAGSACNELEDLLDELMDQLLLEPIKRYDSTLIFSGLSINHLILRPSASEYVICTLF